MNITHEERVEFLNAHNDLKSMLMTVHECNDLWISDVGKLEIFGKWYSYRYQYRESSY